VDREGDRAEFSLLPSRWARYSPADSVLRRHIRLEAARPSRAREASRHDRSPAEELLRLQPLVGNSAVTALINRALLQRDSEPPGATLLADARDEPNASTFTMEMSDIGSFPLLSVQIPAATSPGVGKRPRGTEKMEQIHVVRNQDRFSSEIARRAADGRKIDTVTVVAKRGEEVLFTLTLRDVFISSFHVAEGGDSPTETLTLDAASSEIVRPDPAP
jgi:hypothetical protein